MTAYACHVDDVPLGEGRTLTVGVHRIALFRSAEGWFALDAACPHAGGPLADGILCDHAVTCPLHDRRFALVTGEALTSDDAPVATHAVELRGDRVYVTIDAGRPAARAA